MRIRILNLIFQIGIFFSLLFLLGFYNPSNEPVIYHGEKYCKVKTYYMTDTVDGKESMTIQIVRQQIDVYDHFKCK